MSYLKAKSSGVPVPFNDASFNILAFKASLRNLFITKKMTITLTDHYHYKNI